MSRRRRQGFTLVELLVVIGIIALLISILLPSLNRARQAANAVDCSARMRQIGLAVHMYAAQWKGTLPPANTLGHGPGSAVVNKDKFQAVMLSELLGNPEWQVDRIFHDLDTIDVKPGMSNNPYNADAKRPYTSHYTPNMRLFPVVPLVPDTAPPGLTGEQFPQARNFGKMASWRNLGDVSNASEVAAWWDATQHTGWAGSQTGPNCAWYTADSTDNGSWYNGTSYFMLNAPGVDYNRTVISGNKDVSWGIHDAQGGIRFRHNRNTTANILYLDGHVGQHTWSPQTKKTSMPLTELCVNFK
jgi:prepilin-type N-terminal cleavage/methylation domain-containing protein/prepilin-type processing-associated H-X9-DG protein